MVDRLDMSLEDIIKKSKSTKTGNSNGIWRHDLFKTLNPGPSQTKRSNPLVADSSSIGGLSIQQRLGTNIGVTGRMSIKGVAPVKQEFSIKGEGGPATIVVSNLASGTSANDVKTAFMDFGDILTLDMKSNKNPRLPVNAELTFESKASALAAIKKYNTALVDGRVLKVQLKQAAVPTATKNIGSASYRLKNKFSKQSVARSVRNGKMYSDELIGGMHKTNARRVSDGKGKQPSFSVTL
ncbi:452_t:CDS:2 [Ambispora gerdemannii]|uniref:452_t:CDS:1 n=1 Tax=Ambispora gerdemannii TaxID=144530 RepID=A0A9N8ZP44_9GLOM|nr:452_t:CDS:2 [Ambispora gerdemannii]